MISARIIRMIMRAGAPVTVCMAIFISYLSVADLADDDGGTCRDAAPAVGQGTRLAAVRQVISSPEGAGS